MSYVALARDIKPARTGVAFVGALEAAYRACLWSRLASCVPITIARFPAADPQALYEGVRAITWDEHLACTARLAVHFSSARSAKVKDAIVDQFRERLGTRPCIDPIQPDVRVNVHAAQDLTTRSIGLAGQSLHRRGYRCEQTAAPLKDTLAAAILLRAEWPRLGAGGVPLLNPMCGSGTLPIEAVLMAGDCAPGMTRDYFGFLGWRSAMPPCGRR
jgi:23S rRNA (guanine2445-N2)-methyltransferase / 23S rRNA (guanine2069-N7)-methyltransferase